LRRHIAYSADKFNGEATPTSRHRNRRVSEGRPHGRLTMHMPAVVAVNCNVCPLSSSRHRLSRETEGPFSASSVRPMHPEIRKRYYDRELAADVNDSRILSDIPAQ